MNNNNKVKKPQLKDLVTKLNNLECEMAGYRFRLKHEKLGEDMIWALKADIDRCEYQYKALTMDLTDEDRDEMDRLADKQYIKLKYLHVLKFTDEEKEDYIEMMATDDCVEIPGEKEMFERLNATGKKLKKETKRSKKKMKLIK